MNEGIHLDLSRLALGPGFRPIIIIIIHLDLDTWIVPGQIRKANLCRGLGNR